jgi:hypothetical protein
MKENIIPVDFKKERIYPKRENGYQMYARFPKGFNEL